MSIITLATDFGTVDGYPAAMKGVIKSISPQAEIIDVTHDLTGVVKSSFALARYYRYYPAETIHLLVVDPTVGSSRRALVGFDGRYYYVGPDNGIFTGIMERSLDSQWREINIGSLPSAEISATFHGRDIFAPAAALIAAGEKPADLGDIIDNPVLLKTPLPAIGKSGIEGVVIDIDNFGNLITNLSRELIKPSSRIKLPGVDDIPLVRAFSDVPRGKPLAYIGSMGYLEIAINLGRADSHFGADLGWKVMISS